MEFTIQHTKTDSQGAFSLYHSDREIGRMEYSIAGPHKIIASHTEVSPDYKGQGLGDTLLAALTDYARNNQIKVLALCPFVKARFTRNQDQYQDIIV